jgi:hypothetical protein
MRWCCPLENLCGNRLAAADYEPHIVHRARLSGPLRGKAAGCAKKALSLAASSSGRTSLMLRSPRGGTRRRVLARVAIVRAASAHRSHRACPARDGALMGRCRRPRDGLNQSKLCLRRELQHAGAARDRRLRQSGRYSQTARGGDLGALVRRRIRLRPIFLSSTFTASKASYAKRTEKSATMAMVVPCPRATRRQRHSASLQPSCSSQPKPPTRRFLARRTAPNL